LAGTVALIWQSPPSSSVTVTDDVPEAVQTAGVADSMATGNPEVDDALMVNGAAPYVWVPGFGKVMV